MQFIDLAAQQERIRPALDRRLAEVLRHGRYIMGPEVAELETALASICGTTYCVSCANGTDALQMAMMALGLKPGQAVLTTPFTFMATAECIALLGAVPVFVDIDPETFNLDPRALAEQGVFDFRIVGRQLDTRLPVARRVRGEGQPIDGLVEVALEFLEFGGDVVTKRVGNFDMMTGKV